MTIDELENNQLENQKKIARLKKDNKELTR